MNSAYEAELISKLDLLMHIYKSKYNRPEYRKRYTGIYGSWYAMKQRCDNKNNRQYKDYGGRGITYESKWKDFTNFYNDMFDGYRKGLTIDRIDNNKGYFEQNCRWASRKDQNRNKRCCHILTFENRTMTLPDWAEFIGIEYGTLRSRFYRKLSINKILSKSLLNNK